MRVYGSRNVSCIVNGVPLTGLADGDDVFTFNWAEERAQKNVGIDGAVALSITNDDTGEVTIKLMQTSPQNAYLQGLAIAQAKIPGSIPIAMLFQDTYRLDRIIGINGWIQDAPDVVRGGNINKPEWKFGFESMQFVYGTL